MNEINTLTLEIMQNTGICDIETAQEIAELVINKLDYRKEQPKISPLALILAQDLQKVITSCDYDCDTCRYVEFKDVEFTPNCLNVKTAEALIALGWTKEISHNEGVNDMEKYTEVCGDNRFELIQKYKEKLIEATNIETSKDEMNVIDSVLFRFWQMGWLDRLEEYEQLTEDFERALYYAGKNNNVCNFCTKDCGEVVDGVRQACKGKEVFYECQPKWRGIREPKADGE